MVPPPGSPAQAARSSDPSDVGGAPLAGRIDSAPLVLCLLVLGLYLSGALNQLENWMSELKFRVHSRQATGELLLVDIDPNSLQTLGVWPWPRGYHASVLEELIASGARKVAFDIDFSSRSDPDQDEEFAAALAEVGSRVVLPLVQQWQHGSREGPRLVSLEPLPEFRRSVGLGSISVQPDRDGLVRRYRTHVPLGEREVPALAVALLENPTALPESMFVDYGIAPETIPRVSYVSVLAGAFDRRLVDGKAVIVGATAIELNDQLAVPIAAALPGPLLQGLAFESLVQERALQRLPRWPTALCTLLLALLASSAIISASWRRGALLALFWIVLGVALSLCVQWQLPYMLEISPWILCVLGIHGVSLVRRIDRQAGKILSQRGRLQRSEITMRHVVQNSFEAIVTLCSNGELETLNRAARQMFGYPQSSDVAGKLDHHVRMLRPGDPLEMSNMPYEAVGRRVDGSAFPIELTLSEIESDGEGRRVAFLRDITERKSQEQALLYEATHDGLTGLPNRYRLRELIDDALSVARMVDQPVAVLLLDLDRFKEINDVLGHRTGDLLLEQIAKRLRGPMRREDSLARLGGDEFAVMLPRTDRQGAVETARRLRLLLEEPFSIEGLDLEIDMSIGIALFPDHADDPEEIIQRADVAMYAAKRTRSGLELYEPEQDHSSVRQLTLTGELRHAIKDGGLSLVYQPKLFAQTDGVMGVEALLRWQHPELGFVPPDELVAHAEHTGLIQPLTRWVLETALEQASRWSCDGHPLIVSVNVSARNLLESDLPGIVRRMLAAASVPPGLLTLEITESAIMEDPQRALQVVISLHEIGVGISIDDFGTGYSSLGYLKKLPAGELKIDKSFVMEMDKDRDDAMIVRSTVDLAHNLGLKVVAEGVETLEIWDALKALGCDIGQGYYFSKPLPPVDLAKWITSREQPAAVAVSGGSSQALTGSSRFS